MLDAIRPVHHSVLARFSYVGNPSGMERLSCSREESEMLERTAIGIFTDMVNSGRSFQASLAAIYLSGLQHASAIRNEMAATHLDKTAGEK